MSNAFMKPSEAPAGGDGWKFSVEENIGALFVIEPLEELEIEDKFKPGQMRKVINSNITEIDLEDPENDSETHEEVWVFPAWIMGAIRSSIGGGMVLGRLEQDSEKGQGKNAAWVIEDPDEEDQEAALKWLNSRNKAKLSGGDSEKSGKKKKSKKG